MGGEQAATCWHRPPRRLEARGEDWPAEDEEAFKAPIRDQYEHQGHPYYATARLWDDGVIDPAETRTVLGLALSACANAPLDDAALRRLPDVGITPPHPSHSSSPTSHRVRHRAGRQPRRDRRPGHPHPARAGHPLGRRVQRRRRRRAARPRRPTSPSAIGPAPAAQSYLSIERVLEAAARTGAQADPPRLRLPRRRTPAFARGLRGGRASSFIGPPAAAIEAMGDKIRAKQTVTAAGRARRARVGRRAGHDRRRARRRPRSRGRLPGAAQALRRRRRQGHARGRARRRAAPTRSPRPAARPGAPSATTRCSSSATSPTPGTSRSRCSADAHGNVVHLGERECSLQRRHQKVDRGGAVGRCSTTDAAARDGRAPPSRRPGPSATPAPARSSSSSTPTATATSFFFLEMNTRLQVEHPVTEMVTGADLVEQQLRVAAGEPLPLRPGAT